MDAATLKTWLRDGAEIALLDVREYGEHGESHLFHAVNIPYSRIELEIERLVPCKSTRVALYDDGASGVAERAAMRAAALGYDNVQVLDGGTRAWAERGYRLYAGVNVPSKAFGELVEHECHTPRISARDLEERMRRGDDLIVVDGRPFSEYQKMNIPGSVCCPNAELALRIARLAPDPHTEIVINCAGRTRSIIGAQGLLNVGVPNRVYALENGTQGWFLAGFELEQGAQRKYAEAASGSELSALRSRTAQLIERFEIPFISSAQARDWLHDEHRTTYLLDVRTPEEFAARHLPGSRHAPGGQLVQGTDQWIGVRGAKLILVDSDGVRAPWCAMWLRQMGHDAHVLEGGVDAELDHVVKPRRAESMLPDLAEIDAGRLRELLAQAACEVIDLRSSMSYRRAHVPQSRWSIRPRLNDMKLDRPIVLISDEPMIARAAASELSGVSVLSGGFAAWTQAGYPTESSPDMPADAGCIDYLFFTHDRHEGNRAAAEQYLAWEIDLLRSLDPDERASFRIIPTRSE